MALEPFQEKSPPLAKRDRMGEANGEGLRSGVPEGLEPRSTRWMARAALAFGGHPETPYLCVCVDTGAAARSGGEGAATRAGSWRARCAWGGGGRSRRLCRGESSRDPGVAGRLSCSGWRDRGAAHF